MENIIPKLFIMCGPPGSGKSTLAKEISKRTGAAIISSDQIREELLGSEENQSNNNLIFKTLHARLHSLLSSGQDCIYDACNISKKTRKKIIQEFKEYRIIIVYSNTTLDICLKRNSLRKRKVPNEVIKRMYNNLQEPELNKEVYMIIKVIS